MSPRVPVLGYRQIIRAMQRDGWVVVRQRGSHVWLQKGTRERTLKVTVPAHTPVKRRTLSRIPNDADIDLQDFLELL